MRVQSIDALASSASAAVGVVLLPSLQQQTVGINSGIGFGALSSNNITNNNSNSAVVATSNNVSGQTLLPSIQGLPSLQLS